MAFPDITVELALDSYHVHQLAGGWTDITKYVDAVSGSLRGRSYELDKMETGSITVELDNADGRFTPGLQRSPFFPRLKPNRQLRIRGRNMQRLDIALTSDTDGFETEGEDLSLVEYGEGDYGFTGELGEGGTYVSATIPAGTAAGTYRVLSWWAPVERGVRLTNSAWVWRESGTPPASTKAYLKTYYYDVDGNETPGTSIRGTLGTLVPVRLVTSDFPPNDVWYSKQALIISYVSEVTEDLTYGVVGIQSEVPANLMPSISGQNGAEAFELTGGGSIVYVAGA